MDCLVIRDFDDIAAWKPVIGVAAVACSDLSNAALCRNYGISGFPSVKFFPPNALPSERGKNYPGEKSQENLYNAALSYLDELISSRRTHSSWPRMDLIRHLSDLLEHGHGENKFVIVEDSEALSSHLGITVILDLLDLSSAVAVGRMSLTDAVAYGAHSRGLYALTQFNQLYLINVEYDRHSIVTEIRRIVGRSRAATATAAAAAEVSAPPMTSMNPTMNTVTPFTRIADGLHMQDIESSLYYSLWVEVPSRNRLDGDALSALKQHIDVMSRYLPAENHITNFLEQTNRWLKTKTGSLSASEWLHHINNMQNPDAYVPSRVLWTWCHGSRPQFRGYPCSLWMTFHALTVSAYVRESNNRTYSPDEVISSIRAYIEQFLGCRQCAANFARGSARLLDSSNTSSRYRQRRDGAVMWLWVAHNRANRFLSGDPTEDPNHPKIQFPSRQACPRCYNAFHHNDEISWDEAEVLNFLQTYYGASHIIDDDIHDAFNIGNLNITSLACQPLVCRVAFLLTLFLYIVMLAATCC